MPLADLASRSYVAEEYYLEGSATQYRNASADGGLADDGRWDVEEDGTADYRTRVLVVRPAEPSAFNGTAVVSWLNVTAGYDLGSADDDEILGGYAWIGVSAQKVGIDGFPAEAPRYSGRQAPQPALKAWDPDRYGSLVHPGDRFSFDIFTQAGRAVTRGDVMGNLSVQRVIATGASQSGARLTTYVNAVHPVAGLFDAFVPTITGGWGTLLGDVPTGTPAADVARRMARTKIRDDIDSPVLIVNSECEAVGMYPARRDDDDGFRFWEVAGAPHVVAVAPASEPRQGGRIDNPLTYRPVLSAGFRAVHGWLVDGTPPPSMPKIEFESDGTTIRRDERGNAVGGIRLPEVAAPVAEYHGRDEGAVGLLTLYGWARPFTRDELRVLYPSRSAYAEAYRAGVEALASAGGLRPEDIPQHHDQAEKIAADLDL
jgi:hypothetical protein